MKRFAELHDAIDRSTATSAKLAAMAAYFREAPPEDAAWAVFALSGRRIKRLVPWSALRDWTLAETGLSGWLFDESATAVGDLAETCALLLDLREPEAGPASAPAPLHVWMQRVLGLREQGDAAREAAVRSWWRELGPAGPSARYVLDKLLTGEMRLGVSETLVVRALAEAAGVARAVVAERLIGGFAPSADAFRRLTAALPAPGSAPEPDSLRPYPFYLATPLPGPPAELGPRADWLAEWKWDGIRAELVRRGSTELWSRGEERITARFPEVLAAAAELPPCVLDGELMAFRGGAPLPFALLQRRIGRQKLTPAVLASAPAAFVAFDLLELGGVDLRERPLRERRAHLAELLAGRPPAFQLSSEVAAATWQELAARRDEARTRGVEGVMLKRWGSPYRMGRPKGDWWKWKLDPYTIDAVLIYAQAGHGRRASLFTDYTFGVWSGGELVPVAKAYSGLSNDEIAEMDRWIRAHTLERHGPVRAVEPLQVFEVAFEGIAESTRHRSGIALRFPRIARWRQDKRPADADTLERVRALLPRP